jgi:sugar phosphate isomerase/epimerase
VGIPNVAETAQYYADFGLTPTGGGAFSTVDGGEQLRLVETPTRRLLEIRIGADDADDIARVADELASAADVAASRGVNLWTESLHLHRLCWNLERSQLLADRLPADVGIVMDFSHIVASGGDPVEFVARFGRASSTSHPRRRPGQHQPLGRPRHGRLR